MYAAIGALLLAAPVEKLDVAKLEPVEVVYMYQESGQTVLQTDTHAKGKGEDALSALLDLRENTAGVVYLDTAQYLLVAPDTLAQIPVLAPQLQRKVKLCMAENIALEDAANYLDVHGDLPCLRQWETGEKLPLWDGE